MRKELIAAAGAAIVLTAAFLGKVRTSESPVSDSPCASLDIEDDQERGELMEKKIDLVLGFMDNSEILALREIPEKFREFEGKGLVKIEPYNLKKTSGFVFLGGYPDHGHSNVVFSIYSSILDRSDKEAANELYVVVGVLKIVNSEKRSAAYKADSDNIKKIRNQVEKEAYAEVTHPLEILDSNSGQGEAVSC